MTMIKENIIEKTWKYRPVEVLINSNKVLTEGGVCCGVVGSE